VTAIDLNDGTATELEAHIPGMTLRDYFAGQALAGVFSDNTFDASANAVVETCYRLADAMLKQREE